MIRTAPDGGRLGRSLIELVLAIARFSYNRVVVPAGFDITRPVFPILAMSQTIDQLFVSQSFWLSNNDATFRITPGAAAGRILLSNSLGFASWANVIPTGADANVGLAIQANSSSQTANLQEWRDSSNVVHCAVSPYGTYWLYDVAGAGIVCGSIGGSDGGASTNSFVEFTANGYLDNTGTWQRFDTTKWTCLNQVYGTTTTGQFQIYAAAPAANPIGNYVLNFLVDASSKTVTLAGGQIANRTAVNDAAYSILTSDFIIAYTALTAARTATLPTAIGGVFLAPSAGQHYYIKDESGAAAAHNITIATTGGQTIDGAANATINTNFGKLHVYSNGANWFTL